MVNSKILARLLSLVSVAVFILGSSSVAGGSSMALHKKSAKLIASCFLCVSSVSSASLWLKRPTNNHHGDTEDTEIAQRRIDSLHADRVKGFDHRLFVQSSSSIVFAQNQPLSPSDTVRAFYKTMREKKFREAFAMSIYRPAIEPLNAAEFEDLRGDFEKLAAVIPEQVNITGEQISGEIATVFVKVKDDANKDQAEPVTLILIDGNWIVGDKENHEIVKKAGKDFFFNARINTHHDEVQAMLLRISLAQLLYSKQNAGKFADLATLILGGMLPKDLEGTESTGYRFRITTSADRNSWRATAEPAQYGRTGRLSFFMDASGVRSGDVGGKPLPAPKN